MAHKLQLLKLLQEIRGFADLGNKSPEFKPLIQASVDLRAAGQPTTLPVRRFSIPVSREQHQESPSDIPITPAQNLMQSARRVTKIAFRSL